MPELGWRWFRRLQVMNDEEDFNAESKFGRGDEHTPGKVAQSHGLEPKEK